MFVCVVGDVDMANRKPKADNQKLGLSKEAFEYVDDVTVAAVQSLQDKVGVDFSSAEWCTVGAFGRVINA